MLSTLCQDQWDQDKVGSGHGPKGTEGEQAFISFNFYLLLFSQVFIFGDHTAPANLSRNIQVLPVHSMEALKPM